MLDNFPGGPEKTSIEPFLFFFLWVFSFSFNCVLSCAVADAEVHWCAGNLGKSGGRRVGGRGRGGRHPVQQELPLPSS